MSWAGYLLAAVFLPLFPFSMLFNQLFARIGGSWLRIALLLVWPQLGILALVRMGESPPAWMLWWAVLTAALYALRSLTLRDLHLWVSYIATSAWALLWLGAAFGVAGGSSAGLAYQAAGLSLPFVLLTWLAGRIELELGAAYAGVSGGLAQTMPRLSGLLVLSVLAAVATPLVPGFFAVMATVVRALAVMPSVALVILIVWMLWAWSGSRILRGFVVGRAATDPRRDLGVTASSLIGVAIVAMMIAGVGFSGQLI